MSTTFQEWQLLPIQVTGPLRWYRDGSSPPILLMATTGPTPKTPEPYATSFDVVYPTAAPATQEAGLTRLEFQQLLPAAPAWDIVDGGSGPEIVAERFGGALTELFVQSTGEEAQSLQPGRGQGYSRPRFVQDVPNKPGSLLTAVTPENALVLFERTGHTSRGPSPLGDAQDGLVLLSDNATYNVLLNAAADAEASPLGQSPGSLSVEIRKDLTAAGVTPTQLLPKQLVYEFDAIAEGSPVYLLAITGTGPVLNSYVALDQQPTAIDFPAGYPPKGWWATSPTLARDGANLYLAFVEYEGDQPTGVRIGRL